MDLLYSIGYEDMKSPRFISNVAQYHSTVGPEDVHCVAEVKLLTQPLAHSDGDYGRCKF